MAQNISNMIATVREAGTRLGITYLTDIANEVEVGCNTDKLLVTVIGKSRIVIPIIESLLDNVGLLPSKIALRSTVLKISIGYADSSVYKISKNNQLPFIVTKELLCQNINSRDDFFDEISVHIGLNNEFLKTMDISVIVTDNGYDAFPWQMTLLKSDYTFIALDALQLLSMSEQNFISTILNETCNPERYSVIVSLMEYVVEEERADVLGYIDSFTLQLNNVIPQVIPFGKEEVTPLSDFIYRFIPANAFNIRQKSQAQNSVFLERELLRCCFESRKSLLDGSGRSLVAIKDISVNCESVQSRIESMERNIALFINGHIKSKFIRNIDLFSESLNIDIRSEILDCQDMNEVSRQIPVYLKEVWSRFIEQQNQWLKKAVFTEIVEISKTIESDIREVVSSFDAGAMEAIKQYLPAKFRYNAFLFPKRDKGDSLKYVDLGALALLLFSVPWAVVTFGTSQLIRYFFKEERLKAKKESLAQAVVESSNKMKNQIINQADIEIDKIASSLKEQTRGVYQSILQDFIAALEVNQSNINHSEELIEYIDSISVAKCISNQ